jgi:hypothetical protein
MPITVKNARLINERFNPFYLPEKKGPFSELVQFIFLTQWALRSERIEVTYVSSQVHVPVNNTFLI